MFANPAEQMHTKRDQSDGGLKSIKDSITFKLSVFAAFSERLGSAHFTRQFALTLTEWRIIALTGEADWTTQGEIRQNLLIDKAQASRCVKGLVQKGLLKSRLNEADSRKQELALSERGHILRRDGLEFVADLNGMVFSVLSKEEVSLFNSFLDRLIERKEMLIAREFSR